MSSASQAPKLTRFGQAFVNYGSYHYDTVNKIIHIICIPLIVATLFYLLSFVPFHIKLESLPIVGDYSIGAAEALWTLAVAYYIYLNPLFGILAGLFFYGAVVLWRHLFQSYTNQELFTVVLIIQIFAWGMQFIGHGVFEKRKPALMDNATQILNAPMFVLIELCEMFGLKTKQLEEWKVEIKKNVFKYREDMKKTN